MKNAFSIIFFFFFVAGAISVLSSCKDEGYSVDSTHLLTFSQDTLSFDTVFTSVGSATAKVKVYNHSDKPLNISSITLANAEKSYFKINVDGEKGIQFSNIELQRKDSMYIFVEVNVAPQNRDNPLLIKDSLVFLTNGIKQNIKLMAYGQDAIVLKGKTVSHDTTFTAQKPIIVYDSLKIDKGAKLHLEAGTKLYFHDKASMKVYGNIDAQGILGAPVLFRGDRLDNMFSYLPYNRIPGQWEGIHIYSSSYGNKLNYVDIHSAQYGIYCDSSSVEKSKLTLVNSVLHNVSDNAVKLINCKAEIINCQITNAGKNCVDLIGGDYKFIHCTVANFFSWGIRSGVAFAFTNYFGKLPYPINVSVYNSLITGSLSDEINGNQSTDKNIAFNYYFSHSLINSPEEVASEKLVNILWHKESNFQYIGKQDYKYDFRPDSLCKAINIADIGIANDYPYDLNGRSRLIDNKPDAGCYEWVSGDK